MPNQTEPFISVVVPAYNLEKLITRCLDSITAQTFQDWECIVVNDGSIDETGVVCEKYAKADSRFKVLHKENGGVSSARNAGMGAAKGQYLMFVDGDDAIDPQTMEWIASQQRLHPNSLIGWSLRDEQDGPPDYNAQWPVRVYTAAQKQAYIAIVSGTNITNKLFWADVIQKKQLQYNVAFARGEDYDFSWAYLNAFFELYPEGDVRQCDIPIYWVFKDNREQRASSKKVKAHAIEWEPEECRNYTLRLREEYGQMIHSMGGFEAMADHERMSIAHQYIRRFAFAVWAAHELQESLSADFFTGAEVKGLIRAMQQYQLYDAYYFPFVLKWKWLIRKMYHSDESESKKLYWRVFLVGDILLGRKWKRL